MTRQELPGSLYDLATGRELADSASVGGLTPPQSVALAGELLEFTYSKQPFGPDGSRLLPAWPGRRLLLDLKAADSDERLRAFAAKWGLLGTCSDCPTPEQSIFGGTWQGRECLACWRTERDWARQFMDRLTTAATTRSDSADDSPELARRELLDQLNAATLGVLIAPVALADGWRDGALHTRVAWSTVPGLHGYLVIAALGWFAQAGGSALPTWCSGCGALFTPGQRVRRTQASYCPDCADRARWRKASRDYRARQRRDRLEKAASATLAELKAQVSAALEGSA
ncbi:MAG: hypothetical protein ACYDC5_10650 [Candidatus Dormibacteria bacterium]